MTKVARIPPDWERIEADFRAGVLSLREIAAKDGNVTEGAIRKRAKKDDWVRDLAAKIRARADDMVRRAAVRTGTQSKPPTEGEVVVSYATLITQVRQEHHVTIERARNLVSKLMGELEDQTDNRELFAQLGDILRSPDEHGNDKRHEIYAKVMSLPSRVGSVKALTDALKNLIALEREAYNLDATPESDRAGRVLTDAERASRLATILERARVSADKAAPTTDLGATPEASDARH
jgi:hypothetical protein